MIPMIVEADPNADLELWVKRCDRAILERMYFLVFEQAKMAMAEVERLKEQLKNERGLPDKFREGMYSIRMINGVRHPYYMVSHDTVRTWLLDTKRYLDEIESFFEDSLI